MGPDSKNSRSRQDGGGVQRHKERPGSDRSAHGRGSRVAGRRTLAPISAPVYVWPAGSRVPYGRAAMLRSAGPASCFFLVGRARRCIYSRRPIINAAIGFSVQF